MAGPGQQAAQRTDPGRRFSNSSSGPSSGSTGVRGPVGANNLPIHTNATGPAGVATAAGGGSVGSPFQAAKSDYTNKSWLGRQFNVEPSLNDPASYKNSISHFGMNIPGTILGAITGAFLPGAGLVATPVASALMRSMGVPDTVMGSGTGTAPQPGQGFNYSGVGPQGRFGQGVNMGQQMLLGPGSGAGVGTPAWMLASGQVRPSIGQQMGA